MKNLKINLNNNYNLGLKLLTTKYVLYIIGIALLIISYMGPIIDINNPLNNYKSDIVFVLDVSKSMDAQDVTNEKNISRLNYSKKIISNFANKENQNNYGLVIFAGNALSISPLTNDIDWFVTNLDQVNSDTIKQGGTSIAEAIKEAILDIKETKAKNIIIISDGEDMNNGVNYQFLKETKAKIKIFAIGVGSEKGDYIPTGDDFLGNPTYKSYEGQKVITKLNENSLKDITNIGAGEYLKGNNTDILFSLKNKLIASNSINYEILKKENDNGYIFAVVAFIFFMTGYLINDKRVLGKK
ncbi:MAG: VWA domain-containing protein [Candidatus Gracilibacteria bacterium]|nr:VWA domain-containing protein [Candidatus Gracilibacteria bacterium]MDD2908287.1 VWA domain-containing protein [Candidatus Gracilibacteria bacterium]